MKTKEQIIEEAIEEAKHYVLDRIEEGYIEMEDPVMYPEDVKEIATRKAQELPGPVSSPSDLIVEVDGKRRGNFNGMTGSRISIISPEHRHPFVEFTDRHIRLLTPGGGVVMDNKME